MKVKRHNTQKRYLYIQMNGEKKDLGLTSLIDATCEAHKMVKQYLYAHLSIKEVEARVMSITTLKDQPLLVTTISAWRQGGKKVQVIHL